MTRLRVIFMDYNYQYLAKCQSLYLVLFLIIYIGRDETILCTICILPPGLFINTNGAYVLWEKKYTYMIYLMCVCVCM